MLLNRSSQPYNTAAFHSAGRPFSRWFHNRERGMKQQKYEENRRYTPEKLEEGTNSQFLIKSANI